MLLILQHTCPDITTAKKNSAYKTSSDRGNRSCPISHAHPDPTSIPPLPNRDRLQKKPHLCLVSKWHLLPLFRHYSQLQTIQYIGPIAEQLHKSNLNEAMFRMTIFTGVKSALVNHYVLETSIVRKVYHAYSFFHSTC